MKKHINELKGYENTKAYYTVDECGNIYGINDKKIWTREHDGYRTVKLRQIDGPDRCVSVHRLVAMAFVEGYQDGYQVNHIDENGLNNHYTNLEWCTGKYNMAYGTRIARITKANSRKVGQYTVAGELVKIWNSTHEAGRSGFDQGAVSRCAREGRTHKGFKWSYLND